MATAIETAVINCVVMAVKNPAASYSSKGRDEIADSP
jgi:hypothetical protein